MTKQPPTGGEANKKPELSGIAMKTPLNYIEERFGKDVLEKFLDETGMDLEYFEDHNNWISFEYAHSIFRKIVELSGNEDVCLGGREANGQPGRGGKGRVDRHEGGRESFSGLQGYFRPCAYLQSSRRLQDPQPDQESTGPGIPTQGRVLRDRQVLSAITGSATSLPFRRSGGFPRRNAGK